MIDKKIKVVRRPARGPYPEGEEPEVYDIYYDVGLSSSLKRKWKIEKSSLDRDEVLKYIQNCVLDVSSEVIIDC